MPEDTDYAPLIERLLSKTRDGRIDWKAGSGDDTFYCNVDKYLFMSQKSGVENYYLRMYEGQSQVLVIAARKHAAGRIDTFFTALSELFELARQRALKIDLKVNEALGLLDKLK